MATTFNPNGYNRTQIEQALQGGMYYAQERSDINTSLSEFDEFRVATQDAYLDLSGNLSEHKASNVTSFATVDSQMENVKDILFQIVYRGSNNRLDLTSATLTVGAGATGSIENGVLTLRKTAVTDADVTITISGFKLDGGSGVSYYVNTGDDLNSENEIIEMHVYGDEVNNDRNPITITSNNDSMLYYNVSISSNINSGLIEIMIDKDYASSVYFHVIPTFAKKLYRKEFSMPYFKSIAEVSSNE